MNETAQIRMSRDIDLFCMECKAYVRYTGACARVFMLAAAARADG